MKKYLFIAVAALAASAACTQVNVETPGSLIQFQAANYVPQTKAIAADPTFTAFPCKAYMHAEGINLNDSYQPTQALGFQNFFGNEASGYTETITYHAGTPVTWTPSHDYYWPKSTHSYINFVGWYGKDSAGAASNPTVTYAWDSTASKYKATLSWAFTQGALGNVASDYLYADMAWRFNENVDPATYTSVSRVDKGVPMLFHHALAKINIKAYAVEESATPANPAISAGSGTVSDGLATWTITLEDVQLTNVYTAGTLEMTNTDPATASTPQAWTKTGTGWTGTGSLSALTPSTCTVDKVTQGTAVDLIAETCVLPQDLAKSGSVSHLTGKVRIVTTYTNATNSELIPFDLLLGTDLGTATWEQNYKYTYYLKINPAQKKIYFDPAIESDYQDGTTTEQVIPDND
ncbi:MAG: fimbrillin family protein [Bacteroidales bacterium]|nr:fimbrillin family protein [Bacteroidales bacterium]